MGIILAMRLVAALLLLAPAACSSRERTAPAPAEASPPPRPAAPGTGPADFAEMEKHNGRRVTLSGTFDHVRGQHGLLRLDSGLLVMLPHFDQFRRGDDWFRYVGKRCTASGVLHTAPREFEGFRGPSLEVESFRGPAE